MVHSDEDDDLMIVQKAVQAARRQDTVVVDEDTDLLVLLCSHASLEGHNIYFRSEKRQNTNQRIKMWHIRGLKMDLGIDVCKHILFAHAILGCDTT